MSKKVKKNNQFGTTGSCSSCGKRLGQMSVVWQSTSLLSLWGKTFCSLKCAKAEGYTESKSWF
ncbi:MAG: hypothetical protein EBV23_09135 [Flavobacteriia bacterium]|jgi:hypothetical protein|nr:hypothetical protein [Flavobacteriia bacterium]